MPRKNKQQKLTGDAEKPPADKPKPKPSKKQATGKKLEELLTEKCGDTFQVNYKQCLENRRYQKDSSDGSDADDDYSTDSDEGVSLDEDDMEIVRKAECVEAAAGEEDVKEAEDEAEKAQEVYDPNRDGEEGSLSEQERKFRGSSKHMEDLEFNRQRCKKKLMHIGKRFYTDGVKDAFKGDDELGDILNITDKGGRYRLIPDAKGSIVKRPDGSWFDEETQQTMKEAPFEDMPPIIGHGIPVKVLPKKRQAKIDEDEDEDEV